MSSTNRAPSEINGNGRHRRIDGSGFPFRAHGDLKKADLDARQDLYRRLAEQIWSPERLDREAVS